MPDVNTAVFSDCRQYRYILVRKWVAGPKLVWIMLNPSTADEDNDDPTIRRVRSFTAREGYGGFVVLNVWSLRATSPRDLHERRIVFEPDNIVYVEKMVVDQDVVVAWGNNVANGPALQKITMALGDAASIRCLGLTKVGKPRHPLYVRGDTPLVVWRGY